MKKFLRLFLLLGLVAAPFVASAQSGRVGEVRVDVDKNTIPIRVSAATSDLQAIAQQAFGAHGRYKLVASGFTYDIRFTAVTPTQVRVDISRGTGGVAASQVFNGATARAALYAAADYAVVQTNGLGLRGFFAARLAFVSERTGKKEVYTSDLFVGEARQITKDNVPVLKPRWSPDGAKIIFTSWFKSGSADIFEYNVNTYQRTTFASFKGTNMGARYSPTGRQVAMVLTGEGTPEIYVSDAQGRGVRRLTRSDSAKSSPAWSPDGTQLIFETEPGPQLHIISASGSGGTRRVQAGSTYAAEADWNMVDPNKIACTVRIAGGRYQISVADIARGTSKVVSSAGFDAIEPCWLADGRHLIYTARDRSTSVLCILDTETGKSTPISGSFGNATFQANVWTAR